MKGLLIKDFQLAVQQKRYFGLICMIGIMLGIGSGSSGTFAVGYMTMVGAFFVISTMSYDEMDNGMIFLLSLPIRRKDYAREKYLYTLLLSLFFFAVGVIVCAVGIAVRNEPAQYSEFIISSGAIYMTTLIFFSVMMPFVMKYGGEKGRTIAIGLFLLVFIAAYFVTSRVADVTQILNKAMQIFPSKAVLVMCAAVLTVLIFFVSCEISGKIMEKKEL